ncbi:MAG: hypothetical protein KDB79_16065 [Acidobacteria bacterium]|nr:hypothetical protein [Acidobacteriota bacterium]
MLFNNLGLSPTRRPKSISLTADPQCVAELVFQKTVDLLDIAKRSINTAHPSFPEPSPTTMIDTAIEEFSAPIPGSENEIL